MIDGRDSLRSLSGLTGTRDANSLELPKGLRPDPFSSSRVVLSVVDVTSALGLAITAGNAILGALESLKSSFAIADHESLVSSSTNLLTGDGTRVSRLNIQSLARRVIDQIDSLVESTEFKYARLISSKGGNVTLQTSACGGSLAIAPHPLDSKGLGIAKLNLLTRRDPQRRPIPRPAPGKPGQPVRLIRHRSSARTTEASIWRSGIDQ